jgi:predicted hydrocarbon binding protein
MGEFLKFLNENHTGGGYLHIKNNKIIALYDRCYCGILKSAKDISPIYCECSAGWFEKLFSSVFEKEVDVKRIDTILNGADKCTFEISF